MPFCGIMTELRLRLRAPTPPSATSFDTYVPPPADGLTSFEPTSGRPSQEPDIPTPTGTATLLASASSAPSRGELVNPARQHLPFFPARLRYSAQARARAAHLPPFGPARSYPTPPGTNSRHRPSSRSPVRGDSTAHARLLATARHQVRFDNEAMVGDMPRVDASPAGLQRRGRTFGDYMVRQLPLRR
jgi:hypothetical protein